MTAQEMERYFRMCLMLTGERDREELLSNLLDGAMDCTRCDAGTLYLLEPDGLHFCRMATRSQGVRLGGHAGEITLPPVPLEEKYVCSWVALHNETINVPDVRAAQGFDFTGPIRYDRITGYTTRSMLVAPMTDDKGELIGVTQLINALDEDGNTVPFPKEDELLVRAMASQAAISITTMRYNRQITSLLDSLVGALSTAIDARSPYNANHTRNMAALAERFLDDLAATDDPWHFDENHRRAFLMAVWLHDVGKLAVPLRVMDKESRLGRALEGIQARFRAAELIDRVAELDGTLSAEEHARRQAAREQDLALIARVNRAGYLSDEDLAAVDALAERTYTDESGTEQPLLTPEEHACLRVRRGTLTDTERSVMQSHAAVTARILSGVTFPKIYERVPLWAAAHHELLNGTGYPNHLRGEQIPREVRLLTILDIFEALTARDRPYKKEVPPERALAILREMADEGAVDGEILDRFAKSRAWEKPERVPADRRETP